MYQRILVPVDGSNTSQSTLKEVARFAQLCPGAAIRFIHVVDLMQASSGVTEFANSVISITKLEDDIRKEGLAILDRMVDAAKTMGFTADSSLVETYGKPMADAIVEDVQTWAADIVIMGTHGYSGLTHLLVGSVAEGVMRHVTVPILLVRT